MVIRGWASAEPSFATITCRVFPPFWGTPPNATGFGLMNRSGTEASATGSSMSAAKRRVQACGSAPANPKPDEIALSRGQQPAGYERASRHRCDHVQRCRPECHPVKAHDEAAVARLA